MYLLAEIARLFTKKIHYRPDRLQNDFTWQNASLLMGGC